MRGTTVQPGNTVSQVASRSPGLMLTMATIGFAVNFWAWALLSPLGPLFRSEGTLGTLTESDVALLVAVPVTTGCTLRPGQQLTCLRLDVARSVSGHLRSSSSRSGMRSNLAGRRRAQTQRLNHMRRVHWSWVISWSL